MIKSVALMVFCLLTQITFAQIETDSLRALIINKPNPSYASSSIGIGGINVKDQQMAPIPLKGTSYNLDFQWTKYKKWGYDEIGFGIQIGWLTKPADLRTVLLQVEYSKNFLIHNYSNRLFLYVGGMVEGNIYLGWNSSAHGYNMLSTSGYITLNPTVNVKYRFNLGNQNFDVSQHFSTPLIGGGALPYYSSFFEGTLYHDMKVLKGTVLHPGNLVGLKSITSLDWRFKKKGQETKSFLRVSYHFTGSRFNTSSKFQYGNSALMLSVVRKF